MAKPTKPAPAPDGVVDYIVTKSAPEKIAGRLVKAGEKLKLTEGQARFDEMSGHLERVPAPAASKAV